MIEKTVITFGTFDLFHKGHLNILNRAKSFGDKLVVGISSDALNLQKKNFIPIFNEQDRMDIVANIKAVDQVFLENSLELKAEYIKQYKASVLVMGSDWKGKFDFLKELCEVIYLERTQDISTTNIKDIIQKIDLS